MTDPENLVLELLRAIRGDIAAMREDIREHGHRLNRIESGVAGVRRDMGSDAEAVSHVQAQMDRLRERLDRVERRLDIVD